MAESAGGRRWGEGGYGSVWRGLKIFILKLSKPLATQ
jgi:hypothetical protein